MLADAELSVAAAARSIGLGSLAARRLAFRELGLALGLHAVEQLDAKRLIAFVPLATQLEDFWLDPAHQAVPSWTEHRDINAVTLAACLAPAGALDY